MAGVAMYKLQIIRYLSKWNQIYAWLIICLWHLAFEINKKLWKHAHSLHKAFELVCCLLSTDNQSSTDEISTNDTAFVRIFKYRRLACSGLWWYCILWQHSIPWWGSTCIGAQGDNKVCNGACWAKLEVADTQGCNLSPNENMVLRIEKNC